VPDQVALDAFRAGDPEALGVLYDAYAGAVWTVAMRILADSALAEDATQETFLRAWQGAAGIDTSRDPGPWLLTIARRTAIDVWRRESRPTQGGHAEERDVTVVLPGIEGVWEAWEVRRALDALPEQEREVVRLAHVHQLTHGEISAALGVPVGTVKSRSHRAHRRLAGMLDHLREPASPPRSAVSGRPRPTGGASS
jgi:RNA polymerase sigma-70 factor (ECF subfamily)